VADRGVHSDKEVAALMGISRQRVNQLEQQALRRLEFRARYLKGGGA